MFFLAEMVKGVSAQLTGETEMLEAKAELFSGRRDSGGRRERYEYAWPLGRIVEVKPNKEDRLVRRVAVKTRKTVFGPSRR